MSTNQPPSGSNARFDRVATARMLFPRLADRLDAALKRNRADESGDGSTAVDGTETPEAWLDDEVDRLRAAGVLGARFADIEDQAARQHIQEAFEDSRAILARIGVTVPEPELFEAAGVDFVALGRALAEQMESADSPEPARSMLQPVIAPHGISAADWQTAFGATDVPSQPDPPSTGRAESHPRTPGLTFAAEVLREFAILNHAFAASTARVTTAGSHAKSLEWTVRLVPAEPAPPKLGLSFEHGPHVTLPEMLMLQLVRAERGEAPVDARSFTWIAGPIGGGRLAARHVFDETEQVVRISARELGHQGPHLGARPPIG